MLKKREHSAPQRLRSSRFFTAQAYHRHISHTDTDSRTGRTRGALFFAAFRRVLIFFGGPVEYQ